FHFTTVVLYRNIKYSRDIIRVATQIQVITIDFRWYGIRRIPDPSFAFGLIPTLVHSRKRLGNDGHTTLHLDTGSRRFYGDRTTIVRNRDIGYGRNVPRIGITAQKKILAIHLGRFIIHRPGKSLQALRLIAAPIRHDINITDGIFTSDYGNIR